MIIKLLNRVRSVCLKAVTFIQARAPAALIAVYFVSKRDEFSPLQMSQSVYTSCYVSEIAAAKYSYSFWRLCRCGIIFHVWKFMLRLYKDWNSYNLHLMNSRVRGYIYTRKMTFKFIFSRKYKRSLVKVPRIFNLKFSTFGSLLELRAWINMRTNKI